MGATHPVVRLNPDTGRKALFVSLAFTKRFKGWTEKESMPLLTYLYEHAIQQHLGCRLSWQPKSLAMWDNRVCLHHGVADYFGEVAKHRRVMQRATIEGEVPISARAMPPKAA
jgi:taurine dioxygenase